MSNRESTKRSLLKAASWRISGSLATVVIVYLMTGQLKLSLAIGGMETIAKFAIYFVHERLWNRIPYGLERSAEAGNTGAESERKAS